jgi:hypothetical protein
MAHKKLDIDWDKVIELLQAQVHGTSIADIIGISSTCLFERVQQDHNMTWGEFKMKHKSVGREKLRQRMFQQAMSGDKTLMIFLAKNYLGMADKVEQQIEIKEWKAVIPGIDDEQTDIFDNEDSL